MFKQLQYQIKKLGRDKKHAISPLTYDGDIIQVGHG